MSDQLSFWGMDDNGTAVSVGRRIVYFLDAGDYVKIGFTTRALDVRLGELQTGNPHPLIVIGSIVVTDVKDERELHQRFTSYHHRGEFFRKTPELLAAIHDLIRLRPVAPPSIRWSWIHFAAYLTNQTEWDTWNSNRAAYGVWGTCTWDRDCPTCHGMFVARGILVSGSSWSGRVDCARCRSVFVLHIERVDLLLDRIIVPLREPAPARWAP